MRRTVLVSREQRRRVRVEAAARELPVADIVRPAVDHLISTGGQVDPPYAAQVNARTAELPVVAPAWWWDRADRAAQARAVSTDDLINAALAVRHTL